MRIPCISLWQPWASWVADGIKTIETRKHNHFASLAGKWVAIHAAKKFDVHAVHLYENINHRECLVVNELSKQIYGVVAVAHIEKHRQLTAFDRSKARCVCDNLFGLCFGRIIKIDPPVDLPGRQGVFYIDSARVINHLPIEAKQR